jgi:hypothetical protein
MKYILYSLLVIGFVTSCRHKPNFDNMAKVSYSTDIQPIIISNCTQSGCHGSNHSEEFKLLTYNDLIKHTDVKAGSPQSSKLYNVIRTYNSENIMPRKPYDPLTEKQIQLIYVWIGQGALNN